MYRYSTRTITACQALNDNGPEGPCSGYNYKSVILNFYHTGLALALLRNFHAGAGLALEFLQGKCPGLDAAQQQELLDAYYRPEPRLALGQALRKRVGAAQDVSDGLLIDLSRMAAASKVKISVDIAAMPLAGVLTRNRDSSAVFRLAMTAGDDYELIFTAPPGKRKAIDAAARKAGVRVSRIGHVSKGEGVEVLDLSGRALACDVAGFEHFR